MKTASAENIGKGAEKPYWSHAMDSNIKSQLLSKKVWQILIKQKGHHVIWQLHSWTLIPE